MPLIFLLAVGAGVIILQIFLSRKENKWAGLILPLISFLISLTVVTGLLLFTSVTVTESRTVMENGEVMEQAVPQPPTQQTADAGALILTGTYIFLLYNIPTAALLAAYAAGRGKLKRRRALEKMSVQDLH
jgi:hypothetical protein